MKQEELNIILEKHKLYLNDEKGGVKADLRGANLRYANLGKANLSEANLSDTCVFGFCLGKHFGFYHKSTIYESGNYVKIGCIGYSLDYWLANIESIGSASDYSESEISLYKSMIMVFKES